MEFPRVEITASEKSCGVHIAQQGIYVDSLSEELLKELSESIDAWLLNKKPFHIQISGRSNLLD